MSAPRASATSRPALRLVGGAEPSDEPGRALDPRDFDAVFRSLARIDYRGPIAFESFSSAVVDPVLSNMLGVWRNLWSDGYDLARHAKAFMDAQLVAARHATASAG